MGRSRLVAFASALMLVCSLACDSKPTVRERVPEQTWKHVGTWSGRGNGQLETFPIERSMWRLRWETKNESPVGSGRFKVTANSADSGRIVAEIAEVKGAGGNTEYIAELPRRYYLVVTSNGVEWSVTAEEPILR